MGETFNYIFGRLRSSEKTVKSILRTLKRQKWFNRRLAFLTLAAAVYAVTNEIIRKEQNRKIDQLCCELEKLKQIKGEEEMQ